MAVKIVLEVVLVLLGGLILVVGLTMGSGYKEHATYRSNQVTTRAVRTSKPSASRTCIGSASARSSRARW
jgi:hypothetical protein